MIFLSHNYQDKPVVEQVALRLRDIYGQDKVFYDSWSIQPGDGIIDKMNEGLTDCRFFFYFVSANSLKSNMVKMEWQNALYKAAQNTIKFVPVRLDNSNMPAICTQTLYIDLFGYGLDVAIRQIVDVINGTNTFHNPNAEFHNLVAYKSNEGNKLVVECRAEHYLEPISTFQFCFSNDIADLIYSVRNENMQLSGTQEGISLPTNNGWNITANIIQLSVEHGTLPGFPFVAEFSSKGGNQINLLAVYHPIRRGFSEPLPIR